MKMRRCFSVVLLLTMLLVTALPTATPALAQSTQFPSEDAVTEVMAMVNNYWLANTSYPGDNHWERAVYFTGDIAHFNTGEENVYLDAAIDWAQFHGWQLNGGCFTQFADNHAAAQSYIDLYRRAVTGADLNCTLSAIESSMTWAWLEIDLGSIQEINQVNLYPFVQRAYRYYIQVKSVADDPYTTVVNRALNTESNAILTDTFSPVMARYIKLWVVGAHNYIGWLGDYPPVAWVSINELEVLDTTGTNVALNQSVVCSSVPEPGNPCAEAVDGISDNDENRWAASLYSAFVEESPNWWWIDAMYMAMPVYAKLAKETGDPTYLDVMYVRYQDTKNNRSLYDAGEGLWYRDDNYIYPKIVTSNGEKVFWSRGNGWVFAALARVLNELSPGDVGYDDYLATFQTMAAALKGTQRPEGYWNSSLADPLDFPGPESSGTAFFTYGLAWGINNDVLDEANYAEPVAKAWNWMVTEAVHDDGKFGYVQPVGERPGPATYDDTMDYGVGAFLLAGSEVFHLADIPPSRPNLVLNKPVICSSEPEPENPCTNVVDGDLINRWSATPYEQSVGIDLGSPYKIDTVKLYPYLDRAYQYYVEAKVTATEPYTIIVDRSGNTEGGPIIVDPVDNVVARYLRLRVIGAFGYDGEWVSIREFEAYGEQVATGLIVNSIADPGDGNCDITECTLHEAIAAANSTAEHDEITFAVPGDGPHTIHLITPLPTIATSMTINGYSQPGAQPASGTDPATFDAVVTIEIDGSGIPTAQNTFGEVLRIDGQQSTVRGLAINRAIGPAIVIYGSASGNVIDGNLLGSDPSGQVALANGRGIMVNALAAAAHPNRIAGNLIVGNSGAMLIDQSANIIIERNRIGLALNGEPLGNGGGILSAESASLEIRENLIAYNDAIAIYVQRAGATIVGNTVRTNGSGVICLVNGACLIADNLITQNRGIGVDMGGGAGTILRNNEIAENDGVGVRFSFRDGPYLVEENTITGNRGKGLVVGADRPNIVVTVTENNVIANNGELGIDLNDDGVTLNDPTDIDSGVNGLQNFPVVGLVQSANQTWVQGVFNSIPSTEFTLAFYANDICDPSHFGEGEQLLGTVQVTTDSHGDAGFNEYLPLAAARGAFVTATATGVQGTSEFSSCRVVGATLANSLLSVKKLTSRYDPTPLANAPAGVMHVTATFKNQSKATLESSYFRVATLTGGNLLLNADDGPGAVGAVITGPTAIAPNERFEITYAIGLQQRRPFAFFVDAYGLDRDGIAGAMPDPMPAPEFNFSIDDGSFAPTVTAGNSIYLPLINR